ncbi:hypothetical protein [Marinoscillum sp. 108]|uniref:hypothetical protein n=1 Tax=Marinoscillum sp. 108 TaxID=2653151 RepID=UPI0012EF103A|nr:hypothetical protein [Marinoscillum sp. 108]VXD14706.1 hypothetical protein MARINOS108_12082 [Marinoscillum sp. 108]
MSSSITLKDTSGQTFFFCIPIYERGIIKCTWTGNLMEISPAKEAALSIVQQLKETGYTKVIDDNRLGSGPWPDFMDWLRTDWINALLKTNLKSYAHVVSPDTNAKQPAYEIFNQTIKNVDFVTFGSYDMALNWLEEN